MQAWGAEPHVSNQNRKGSPLDRQGPGVQEGSMAVGGVPGPGASLPPGKEVLNVYIYISPYGVLTVAHVLNL